ncbi:hypothetical protein Dimus_022452, partial [Dionaea muscipula]
SDRSFYTLADLGIGAVSPRSFPGVPSDVFARLSQVHFGAGRDHLRITSHSSPVPTGSTPPAGAVSPRSDRDFDDHFWRVLGVDRPRDFSRCINPYREEGDKKIVDAIARAEVATKKEKKATDEFERCKGQLSAMEKNFVAQRNETKSYKAKAEHAAAILSGKESEILSLKDDVEQLKREKAALEQRLKDAEIGWAEDKEKLAVKVKENEILQAENEKYHAKWKDQELEELRLKTLIRYNRSQCSELKKSLVAYLTDADAEAIDNYVKTELYNDAIGDICHQWYGFGFNLARKQAEATLGKAGKLEILDSLDATNLDAIANDVPEEMSFPFEYLPERTATGESPLVLLEK